MLPGDAFIYQQIGGYLAQEPAVYTAYLESNSGGGVSGGLQRKGYWVALTASRLYLIETRVGAFKPLMENAGVRIIERSSIEGVHAKGGSLVLALAGGEHLSLMGKPRPELVSGFALLFDELVSRHGSSPAAAKIASDHRLKAILGAVVGVAVLGYYAYRFFYADRAEVSVSCSATQDDAIECKAVHTSGGADAKACWDLRLTCDNGSHPAAHACTEVTHDATSITRLGESDFRGLDGCDGVTGSELVNLEITVD